MFKVIYIQTHKHIYVFVVEINKRESETLLQESFPTMFLFMFYSILVGFFFFYSNVKFVFPLPFI